MVNTGVKRDGQKRMVRTRDFDKIFFQKELERFMFTMNLGLYDLADFFDISYATLNNASLSGHMCKKKISKLMEKGFRFIFTDYNSEKRFL